MACASQGGGQPTQDRRRRPPLPSTKPLLPLLEFVGEIQQPDLLELRRAIERGALRYAELLCDRVEHGVALLLGAPVGHREDAVGPVLVGGALVAVADATESRHA